MYGRTKLEGESSVRAENPQHIIIRTAWLYGPGGNNFIEKILAAAAKRPELRVVWDEVGCPTHTWDLAEATEALCAAGQFGTFHFVNSGAVSRYELARAVIDMAGIDTLVQPCLASEYPTMAKRPTRTVLATSRYEKVTGRVPRQWQSALKHYMERREKRG
jgi:dTDP-4-dehydrorhamnose reductase